MKRIRIWIGILLIFFSGVVIGGVGGMIMTGKMIRSTLHGDRDKMAKHVVRRIGRKLDLNEEQRAAAYKIVSEALSRAHSLHREVRPRFKEIVSTAVTNLHEHLTPEQREKLDKMHRHWQGRH
jgi:hypothetical protein